MNFDFFDRFDIQVRPVNPASKRGASIHALPAPLIDNRPRAIMPLFRDYFSSRRRALARDRAELKVDLRVYRLP